MTLALVTGTSSGIGLHTAIGLAEAGLSVVATVRDTSRADALRSAASAAGVELDIRALEVTDAAAAEALIEAVGPVDILVNNAGRGAVARSNSCRMPTSRRNSTRTTSRSPASPASCFRECANAVMAAS